MEIMHSSGSPHEPASAESGHSRARIIGWPSPRGRSTVCFTHQLMTHKIKVQMSVMKYCLLQRFRLMTSLHFFFFFFFNLATSGILVMDNLKVKALLFLFYFLFLFFLFFLICIFHLCFEDFQRFLVNAFLWNFLTLIIYFY